ncbi:MAG: hypothetical protein AAFX05_14110 [Planctomycetota bacterium]
MRTHHLLAVCTTAALLTGCSESSSDAPSPQTAPTQTTAPQQAPQWMITDMPSDILDVGWAKASVSEGDTVTLKGRIGGRVDPMSTDMAVFIIVDSAVPSCHDKAHDSCPTPWDYCCEPRDSLMANNATIQLVGDDGAPLAIDLQQHGFQPLDEVVIQGTVAPRPSDAVLIVKATHIGHTSS